MFSALVAGLDADDEMGDADDETVEASKKHDRRLDSTTLLKTWRARNSGCGRKGLARNIT